MALFAISPESRLRAVNDFTVVHGSFSHSYLVIKTRRQARAVGLLFVPRWNKRKFCSLFFDDEISFTEF